MRSAVAAALLASACLLEACSQGEPPSGPPDAAQSEGVGGAGGAGGAPRSKAAQAWSPDARDPEALAPGGLGTIAVGKAPPATLRADTAQLSDSCRTYTDPARRIYVMTDGEHVRRITAMRGATVKTERGIAVGASEAAVRSAYPDAAERPHEYVAAPAKYLEWRPGGGTSGLRFEIDAQGRVSAIHAGMEPQLSYTEGCA